MILLTLLLAAHAGDRLATIHLGTGLPDLIGGGVSITAARPFEIEAGAANGILFTTAFVRAGVALPIHDGRDEDGRGALIEGLALAGWRGLRGRPWTGDDRKQGAEVDLAIEGMWWLSPGFALDAQLLVGGGLWFGAEADGGVGPFTDLRASIGVAF